MEDGTCQVWGSLALYPSQLHGLGRTEPSSEPIPHLSLYFKAALQACGVQVN